ncbi:MAG: 2-dehydropantoate 2-reductase [Kangiellaceae bacterium]|jgi:2-dehydropantoate 2-reductase|nr:2-dehydropantoate 2-reductase [Kangiellaceae bacterium]
MKIAIYGAGSTGCFLGGLLAQQGCDVTFIARPATLSTIEDNGGVTLTNYAGLKIKVKPSGLLSKIDNVIYDVVFVMVKCHALESIVGELNSMTNQHSVIVFMQNGLGWYDHIAQQLSDRELVKGITTFNVVADKAHYHQSTEGCFIFENVPELRFLADKGVFNNQEYFVLTDEINSVIYGKLLLNLNNALNAVAKKPIKACLEDRHYRRRLAAAMDEWLAVCQAFKVKPYQFTKVAPHTVPKILRLPNWLFKLLASSMLAIDPTARSSMSDDVTNKRKTEVDYINGAVVQLAEQCELLSPVNESIVEQLHDIENSY